MKSSDLSEFEIEEKGLKLRIRRGSGGQLTTTATSLPAPARAPEPGTPSPEALSSAVEGPTASTEEEDGTVVIKSPMVGTFYRAPAPEMPPFVDDGAEVTESTVVCIIEAMKVMNEIQAEVKGMIVEALVESGASVEYGQPLFKVKTG